MVSDAGHTPVSDAGPFTGLAEHAPDALRHLKDAVRSGVSWHRALLEAVPVADPRRRREHSPIRGETPSAINPPVGCAFHPRCPIAVEACRQQVPILERVDGDADGDHIAACHRKDEI